MDSSRRKFLEGGFGVLLGSSEAFSQIPKAEILMKPEEATRYVNEIIKPILARVANDSKQIPGLRNRLIEQAKSTKPGGRVLEQAIGSFSPMAKTMIAHMDYSPKEKKPILMTFVPAMQNLIADLRRINLKPDQIDNIIGIIYAHERIHDEIDDIQNLFPSKERVNNSNPDIDARLEAAAWEITVKELVRPALQRGYPLLDDMVIKSELFKALNDDPKNPKWINYFRSK